MKILDACKVAGVPEPELRFEETGLWVVFAFRPDHIGTTEQVTGQVEPWVEVVDSSSALLLHVCYEL